MFSNLISQVGFDLKMQIFLFENSLMQFVRLFCRDMGSSIFLGLVGRFCAFSSRCGWATPKNDAIYIYISTV